MVQHKVEQHIVELAHMPEDSCRTYSEMTRDRVEANVQTQMSGHLTAHVNQSCTAREEEV